MPRRHDHTALGPPCAQPRQRLSAFGRAPSARRHAKRAEHAGPYTCRAAWGQHQQFLWALTREKDAWKISQYFALQRAACGGRFCLAADGHSLHAWKRYEELRANPTGELLPSETNGITGEQWLRFTNQGKEHGVGLDLTSR